MWILLLNDMRASQIEILTPVCRALVKEAILAYLEREKASEPWSDGRWGKTFRQGSPLEWYNPPSGLGFQYGYSGGVKFVGTEDDWATSARQEYQEKVLAIPEITAA